MTHPILALDIGSRRTGVALNPTGSVILDLPTVTYPNAERFLVAMAELITTHQPTLLVVGTPRDPAGPIATLVDSLETLPGAPSLAFVDEAASTKEAERQLAAEGNAHGDSDGRAARLLLEQYLSEHA